MKQYLAVFLLSAVLTAHAQPKDAVNVTYSPDSTHVAYTYNHDLYTLRLSDSLQTRLTFDGSEVILNGYASWVYMEEILGRKGAYRAFWWSPDSRQLAFFRTDDSAVPEFVITDSPGKHGYVETMRYPKAGDLLPQVKVGMVAREGGAVSWAQTEEAGDYYFGLPYWRPDSKALWLQWLNRGQDHYRLLEVSLLSGAVRQLYEERQTGWIAIDKEPRIRFLSSGKGFVQLSDKSGWQHLYLHDMEGKEVRQLTAGSYTVLDVLKIDEKEKTVFFTCFKDNIGCVDFYRVGLNGKGLQRLSFGNYNHGIELAPDGRQFVTTYSNVSTPPAKGTYTLMGQLVKTEKDSVPVSPPAEFQVVRSADGLFDLPMRIILPEAMEAGKRYPVVVAVYGGPDHLQVRNTWAISTPEQINVLRREGVIQVWVDHRGSGHNGKLGQHYMHRQLGRWEVEDYRQCVQWLVDNRQADPAKVMITGFSYGGYITAYALMTAPEVFTHGIAGGSVTDWELYDAVYTERYMDAPQDNPEGYKAASVLTHAGGLQGRLLLTHGLCDENVHVQQTFQLVSVLQDAGKPFELMIYPESRHGYRKDKRIFSRQEDLRFIYRYLLEKPMPLPAAK